MSNIKYPESLLADFVHRIRELKIGEEGRGGIRDEEVIGIVHDFLLASDQEFLARVFTSYYEVTSEEKFQVILITLISTLCWVLGHKGGKMIEDIIIDTLDITEELAKIVCLKIDKKEGGEGRSNDEL